MSISGFLARPDATTGFVSAVQGVFVRLVGGGKAHVSAGPTGTDGRWTIESAPPAGTYAIQTGPSASGPWADTGLQYRVLASGTWVNVLDHGADPTGAEDSTVAIQSAISSLVAGGTVYLPAGTYTISSTLSVGVDNIQIVGSGWGSVIKCASSLAGDAIHVQAPSTGYRLGFRFTDLTLDCGSAPAANGVHLNATYHADLNHITINHCARIALLLDGSSAAYGAYTTMSGAWRILNAAAPDAVAIKTRNHEYVQLQGGLIAWYNAGSCVGFYSENLTNSLIGVTFDMCDQSVYQWWGGDLIVSCCLFDRCSGTSFIRLNGPTSCSVNNCGFGTYAGGADSPSMITQESGGGRNLFIGNMVQQASPGAQRTWLNRGGAFATESDAAVSGANVYLGNDTGGLPIIGNTSAFPIVRNNPTVNPKGAMTPPPVPASGISCTNRTGFDASVFVKPGESTCAVTIGTVATGVTLEAHGVAQAFRLPAGQSITLVYESAPTWTWFGD